MKFKVGDLVRLDWGKSYVDSSLGWGFRNPPHSIYAADAAKTLGFIQEVGAQTALVKWVNGRGGYYKFAELEKIASRKEIVNKNENI